MTQEQWETIERTLAGLSVADKREVVGRLLRSIRSEPVPGDRTRQQREALDRICRKLDAMPAAHHGDGLSNRDHDRILYAR